MQKEFERVDALKNILAAHGAKRVFLVTGGKSYASSGAEALVGPLLAGLEVMRFSDFAVNPSLQDVEKGITAFRAFMPDMVVAVGGGSVMDMAKSVNILACHEGAPADYIAGRVVLEKKGKPLVAIPTTAGSGSEATQFAVVYIDTKKYSLDHTFILPDYALSDPRCTYRLPPSVTAVSGLDALCQAIESYWSVRSTDESKAYAREAIPLALGSIRGAVLGDDDARGRLMRAAPLAGKAINISKTTASHAMSYSLTANFKIPHGHAVALTIGRTLVFNSEVTETDANDERGRDYVQKTLGEIVQLLGATDADDAATVLTSLMRDIGLATRLSDIGVTKNDFPRILSEISPERAGNNPRRFSKEAAGNILEAIL